MMKSMRAKSNKSLVWILLALLILGLAGFGIGGLGGGTIRTIGSVGDEPVTINAYARTLDQRLQSVSRRIGRQVSAAEADSLGVFRDALQATLASAAISNESARLGLSVGDEVIRDELMSIPGFQGVDGSFDQVAYEFALERNGLTTAEFEEELRNDNSRAIVRNAVTVGVKSSGALVEAILAYELEQRDFEWAVLNEGNLEDPVREPTSAEVSAFYDDNTNLYMSLKSRSITYAWLSPDMLSDQVEIGEEELREYYESQAQRFRVPERRSVERIVFGSSTEADAARTRLDAGTADFDNLVVERELEPSDVDLGIVEEGDLDSAAGAAVFALDAPGIAGPAQSSLGPALFRVNAILEPQSTPFGDAREELRGELANDGAVRLVSERVSGIDDLLAAGATIEELAGESELTVGHVELDAETTDGIASYAEFREAAWSAGPGDFPEIRDMDDGGIFIIRLDAERDPELLPLAEVTDRVIADWKQGIVLELLQDMAGSLVDTLASGGEFADVGLNASAESGIRRVASLPGAPPELVEKVFELDTGNVATLEHGGRVVIARLTGIESADLETGNARIRSIQLADQYRGSDMFRMFTTAVQEEAGVTINQAAVNSVNSQLVLGGDGNQQ